MNFITYTHINLLKKNNSKLMKERGKRFTGKNQYIISTILCFVTISQGQITTEFVNEFKTNSLKAKNPKKK